MRRIFDSVLWLIKHDYLLFFALWVMVAYMLFGLFAEIQNKEPYLAFVVFTPITISVIELIRMYIRERKKNDSLSKEIQDSLTNHRDELIRLMRNAHEERIKIAQDNHRRIIELMQSSNMRDEHYVSIVDELKEEIESLADLLSGKEKHVRDSIPSSLRRRVMNRSKCRCEYCGRKGEDGKDPDGQSWHIDHVVPVTRGGPTRTDNLVLACNHCNISKGNRPVHLFVRRLARRMANGEIKL